MTRIRQYPRIAEQQRVLIQWFTRFAGWRQSEAVMTIVSYSPAKRRKVFDSLRDTGCIDTVLTAGTARQRGRWRVVRDLPSKVEVQ